MVRSNGDQLNQWEYQPENKRVEERFRKTVIEVPSDDPVENICKDAKIKRECGDVRDCLD